MAGNRLSQPVIQALDSKGNAIEGATLTFFTNKKTTKLGTFQDPALTLANTNPVLSDGNGYFPPIFLQQLTYTVLYEVPDGTDQWSADDVSSILQVNVTGVPAVDTYADLTALLKNSLTDGTFRQVNGRTTRGDIEPVFFEWVDGDTTTTDAGTVLATDEAGTGRWLMRFEGPAVLLWYGTDSAAMQAAVDNNTSVFIPKQTATYTFASTVNLPANDIEITSNGAVIQAGVGNDIFKQTAHVHFLEMRGLNFKGSGIAVHLLMATSVNTQREYDIQRCEFIMDADIYGISLEGCREGSVSHCLFRTGNGVYTKEANFRWITNCHFDKCNIAIFDDGVDSAFSTGSYLVDCEILGGVTPVKIDRCEDFFITGCTIDFNDEGIQILGQDGGKIIGNYLGTRSTGGAPPVNPAITLAISTAVGTTSISIIANTITGHHEVDAEYDCILISDTVKSFITNNDIVFYTRRGISYGANVTDLHISENNIAPRGGTGSNSIIATSTDDASNKIEGNIVSQAISVSSAKLIANNGFITESKGNAILLSGQTFIDAAHGVAFTPTALNVSLIPTNTAAGSTSWWLESVDATNIRIQTTPAAASNLGFSWQVNKDI